MGWRGGRKATGNYTVHYIYIYIKYQHSGKYRMLSGNINGAPNLGLEIREGVTYPESSFSLVSRSRIEEDC